MVAAVAALPTATCFCRYPSAAEVALLEASIYAKSGNAVDADKVLGAVRADREGPALQALLMRAQLAASNGDTAQVSSRACSRVHCGQLDCCQANSEAPRDNW